MGHKATSHTGTRSARIQQSVLAPSGGFQYPGVPLGPGAQGASSLMERSSLFATLHSQTLRASTSHGGQSIHGAGVTRTSLQTREGGRARILSSPSAASFVRSSAWQSGECERDLAKSRKAWDDGAPFLRGHGSPTFNVQPRWAFQVACGKNNTPSHAHAILLPGMSPKSAIVLVIKNLWVIATSRTVPLHAVETALVLGSARVRLHTALR